MPIIRELDSDEEEFSTNNNITTLSSEGIIALPQNYGVVSLPTANELFSSCAEQEKDFANQGNQIISATSNMCRSSSGILGTVINFINPLAACANMVGNITNSANVSNTCQTMREVITAASATIQKKYESLVQVHKEQCDVQKKAMEEMCKLQIKIIENETNRYAEKEKTKREEIICGRDKYVANIGKEIAANRDATMERIYQRQNETQLRSLTISERMHQRQQGTAQFKAQLESNVETYRITKEAELQDSKQKQEYELGRLKLLLKYGGNRNGNGASSNANNSAPFYQRFFQTQFEQFQQQQQGSNGSNNNSNIVEAALLLRCSQMAQMASSSNNRSPGFAKQLLFQQRYRLEGPIIGKSLLDLVIQIIEEKNCPNVRQGFIFDQNPLDIPWNSRVQTANEFSNTIEQFLMENNWNMELLIGEPGCAFISDEEFFGNKCIEKSHLYVVNLVLTSK